MVVKGQTWAVGKHPDASLSNNNTITNTRLYHNRSGLCGRRCDHEA